MSTFTRRHIDRGLETITILNEDRLPVHREVRFIDNIPSDAMFIRDLYIKGHRNIILSILDTPTMESPFIKVYNDTLGEFSLRISRSLQSQIVREGRGRANINLVIKRAKQNQSYFDTSESVVYKEEV